MKDLIEKIEKEIELAQKKRAEEIETLKNKIKENEALVLEFGEIASICTVNGDEKGFKEAKEKYKDASSNLEVFYARLKHIDEIPIISDEVALEYKALIHEKQKEIYRDARSNAIKHLEEIVKIRDSIQDDLELGCDSIRKYSRISKSFELPFVRTPDLIYDVFSIDNFVKRNNIDVAFKEI